MTGSIGKVYEVKRLFGQWRKHILLIEWADGKSSWEPRKNVNKQLVRDFKATYKGFRKGVKVLGMQRIRGRKQYLLHWAGRPEREKSWVADGLISKELVDKFNLANLGR